MNGARGEVAIMIDGRVRTLCLTLGALAEIETAFGCQTLGELQARMRTLSASELIEVLACLLRGGGETEAAQAVAALGVKPAEAARAVAEAFRAALA